MGERPAKAVATVIQAAAALSGETVRVGFPTDTPARGIWCIATGGPAPIPELGQNQAIIQPRVQVLVRTERRELEACETLAWAVYNACAEDGAEPADYSRIYPAAPPIPIIEPETQRPIYSVNIELTLIE